MTDFQRKCPLCSGEMLRSKGGSLQTFFLWKKPWTTSFLNLGGEEKVHSWACMRCGVVMLYLDRLPAIAEEYKRAGEKADKETSRQIAPQPLKS